MTGLSCPNCGITVAQNAVNYDGVIYCCQGCADRTFCSCRVSRPRASQATDPRTPVGATPKR